MVSSIKKKFIFDTKRHNKSLYNRLGANNNIGLYRPLKRRF